MVSFDRDVISCISNCISCAWILKSVQNQQLIFEYSLLYAPPSLTHDITQTNDRALCGIFFPYVHLHIHNILCLVPLAEDHTWCEFSCPTNTVEVMLNHGFQPCEVALQEIVSSNSRWIWVCWMIQLDTLEDAHEEC